MGPAAVAVLETAPGAAESFRRSLDSSRSRTCSWAREMRTWRRRPSRSSNSICSVSSFLRLIGNSFYSARRRSRFLREWMVLSLRLRSFSSALLSFLGFALAFESSLIPAEESSLCKIAVSRSNILRRVSHSEKSTSRHVPLCSSRNPCFFISCNVVSLLE